MPNEIDNGEILFRYAKPDVFPAGQDGLPTSIFNDPEMSCDWEKHQSSPESSPHVADGRNMVVAITVCDAIKNPTNPKRVGQAIPEWKQEVLHDPLDHDEEQPKFTPNYAHALIKGKKRQAVTEAIRASSTYKVIELATTKEEVPAS